jgi:hypothetical protein
MSRLRKPVRAIREPFGTAGLIVAIVALVAALAGGAYAASGGSGHGQATASAKAKAKAGPRGKTGKTGPAGPQGAPGANGTNGKDGANGTNGTNGSAGISAKAIAFAGDQHGCEEGGLEVTSASPTAFLCNGKAGAAGPLVESLPKGTLVTGAWSVLLSAEGNGLTSISYPFPLASAPTEHREVLSEGEFETECPGSVGNPDAAEGMFCFYAQVDGLGTSPSFATFLSKFGTTLSVNGGEENGVAIGTWATRVG